MADSATAKKLTRPGASFARRYGLAFASVAGALLLDLLFRHFNLPHPFAAFALSAIAITFWYGGTKPGVVAVLLASLIRGFIFAGETSSLSRVLYDLVFLTFAILMVWVRRRKEALEVAIVDRTAKLTAANEDLLRQKEQLDGLFELSPDAVILTDNDFHVLRVNKEFTRMFGYTPEEIAGQWLPELITPEELRDEGLRNRDRLISGNRVELETIRQRKDGVRFDVSVLARGISLGFDQVAVYLIYRDITERKKAERELRRSEGYLAEAQKLTHTGSWAWNVRTGVLFWSREIFSIYDYEYQEMGLTWPQFLERIHPEDRPQIEQSARMEASGKEWLDSQNDFRIILPDGTIKHLHSVAHPVRDESGEITEVVGTVMDVTEQWKTRTELQKAFEEVKQRTEAARRSERELRDVVNTVPAHVWSTSPEGQVDFVNDRWLQFTGLALDEAFGWKWEAVLHPDDRTRVVADWHTALKNGQAMESEARVRRADGEYCWWFIRNVPLRDETGKLVRWYGTAIDIQDRKRAEDALRASEASLLEAQRLTRTCSWRHEVLSGKVTVSAEGLAMYGIEPEDDASSADFYFRRMHPHDRPEVEQAYAAALLRKTHFEADFRLVLPDGTIKNTRSIGHPILDERGDVVEFVGASIDVTEHHRARADLEKAFEEIKRLKDQLHDENVVLREQIDQAFMFEEIVGTSSALQGVLSRVMKVAPTDSSVLVSGETGTGKELVARAIHKRSRRSQRAFVSVNCAALAPSLISSELFGHEKGAFTGAMQRRLGRFELANGGTIFLDEIGELPADTQVALLRVLQEREFERVGGTQPVKIDVRVIAATNRDLEAAVADGTFRPDLYYRLNVFPIQVPPLRERQDDVLMLLEYFVHRFAQKMGKHFKKIDKRTLELFRSYPWPGNIRELQNVVERSVIVSSDDAFSVDAARLSKDPRRVTLPKQPKPADTDEDARRERQIIEEALAGSRGRVSGPNGAAARLRVPPSTLEHRIKKLRIRKSHFKLS